MNTPRKRTRRWAPYLLPNMLTSLNLLAGFYAILAAVNLRFSRAVWAILLAGILDGMDGMAARLTRGTSAFGMEFDSLADLVSFGLAPAILLYMWVLKGYGRYGEVAAFLFVACGALRLARFNVQSGDEQRFHFLGLPIPMAAAQIVTSYLFLSHLDLGAKFIRLTPGKVTTAVPHWLGVTLTTATYLVAFLMVSNIPYRSLKGIRIRRKQSFYVPILFILTVGVVIIYPPVVLWLIATLYTLSGPLEVLLRKTANLPRPPDDQKIPDSPQA